MTLVFLILWINTNTCTHSFIIMDLVHFSTWFHCTSSWFTQEWDKLLKPKSTENGQKRRYASFTILYLYLLENKEIYVGIVVDMVLAQLSKTFPMVPLNLKSVCTFPICFNLFLYSNYCDKIPFFKFDLAYLVLSDKIITWRENYYQLHCPWYR